MIPYDLTDISIFILMTLWLFGAVVARYFILTSLFFIFLRSIKKSRYWQDRIVNQRSYYQGQFIAEIKWSIATSAIFGLAGAIAAVLWQKGYTAIYLELRADQLDYFVLSIVLAMLIHDTYYYWLHRWMHHPRVFPWLHKVHHDSLVASPWTAFSFHPLEACLQAFILPIIVLFLPLHPYAIVLFLLIITLSSLVNHLNVEIYPTRLIKQWPGRLLIGATHHGLHHAQFTYNFGLYFTFWDLWMRTESPRTRTKFAPPAP